MKGMVVRADSGGLGWQTLALARMLEPDRLLIIDSTPFNNAEQHFERFDRFPDKVSISGFPTNIDCATFLNGLTDIITCELPYNWELYRLANLRGIKTYAQQNWEFDDLLLNRLLPALHTVLVPSYWHLADFKAMYRRALYLPPPTFAEDFERARAVNLGMTGRARFLHSIGHTAAHDRNGTLIVLEALKHTMADFELVLKAQSPYELTCNDPRLTLDLSAPEEQQEVYSGFTASIFPRRYGGLALPMNEALMSALPVIMSDVSPNNEALPAEWLVPATTSRSFMARTQIPIYDTYPIALAAKIDEFCAMSDEELSAAKAKAYALG